MATKWFLSQLSTEVEDNMRLYAVKTRLLKSGDDLADIILESLKKQNLQLEDDDVLAVTSKIVAYAQNRLIKLSDAKPSAKAKELAQRFSLTPEFAELVLRESDKIYGGVEKAVLTLKNGILTANAGIDNKNAPIGHVALWPTDVKQWAGSFRNEIKRRTGKKVAILVVDSRLAPLRRGTTGLALSVAGFKPVWDERGEKDIYGKPLVITQHAVADDLASAVHALMGEAAERTPIVLIREAQVEFDDNAYDSADMMIPFKECIFMSAFGYS